MKAVDYIVYIWLCCRCPLQACWCVTVSVPSSSRVSSAGYPPPPCWACAGRGSQPNAWTPELKKQHTHPWSWPLLGSAGAFWQAVLGTWCSQTLFCTWQKKPSSSLDTCVGTLLPARVCKVPVWWLQGVLTSSQEVWQYWNLSEPDVFCI